MAVTNSERVTLLVFVALLLCLSRDGVEGWQRLLKDEDLELEEQLKLVNKPAVKSIETEYGDTFDCVDINKKLAFDHPLVKNHTIQLRPNFIPNGRVDKASTMQSIIKKFQCPPGTVPFRTQKEDLIMAKDISVLRGKYSANNSQPKPDIAVGINSKTYGAQAVLNIWGPDVSNDQFSHATIWLMSNGEQYEINRIHAGWAVNSFLYPNLTRLYTYRIADGSRTTGCYNTLCPGFVQVSPEIPLGTVLQPVSTYAGPQFEIAISIHQDASTGNWWLVFGGDKNVGYWPKSIFTTLDDGAAKVSWGGETFSPPTEASPTMGSGHFAEEGYARSSYFNRLQIAFQSGRFVDPTAYDLITYDPDPKCYNVITGQKSSGDEWGNYFYFGGPGLCKAQ